MTQDKSKTLNSNVHKSKNLASESPWNTSEPDKLGPAIMDHINSHESYFRRWAETWFGAYQFLFGNHNFKWSKKWGFAVDYDGLKGGGDNGAQMRAYTNIARIVVESLSSMLYSNMPEWDTETIDGSSLKGKSFQKITKNLLEGMFHTMQMDKEISAAAFIFPMFGQFAFESVWNPIGGKIIDIQRYQRSQKPAFSSYMAPNQMTQGLIESPSLITDTMGNMAQQDIWDVAKTPDNREVYDKIFAGTGEVNILTPFEYCREIGSPGMHKTKFVRTFKLMDYDDYLDKYGQVGGKTRFYNEIRPVYSNPTVYMFALRHYMRMQLVTPPNWEQIGDRWGSALGSRLFKYKVLVVEHYDKPHPKKWPKGRRVIVTNGVCTHITTPTGHTPKLDGWHPLSEAQWMNAYPSSISSGPMQDVVRKNIELNTKDSLIATSIRRNMGSALLVKHNMGLDVDQLVGEPGLAFEVADPFAARWLHDDMPIPPVLSSLRQMDKEDVYEQSGALDAQRGEPSTGATSGYQEKQREEREEKRLAPARKAFRNALASAGEKLLFAYKDNVVKMDDALMGYVMKTAAGEFEPQDVIAFMTQPIPAGTDIKIVENSMAMKSKATEQALLQELSGGALGQRLATNAKVLDKYLQFFDVETLRDGSAAHRDRAERENEMFIDMVRMGVDREGARRPFVIQEDDDDIHIDEHTDYIVKHWDQVSSNEPFLLEFFTHMEMHRLRKQEKDGQLLPGTAMMTGAMVQQAQQVPMPSVQTIYQKGIMDKQQAQMQPPPGPPGPQGPQGPKGAPQAPRVSTPGQKGGTINPQAPSQNTPPGRNLGGPPNA